MVMDVLINIQKVHVPVQPMNAKMHQPAWYQFLPGDVVDRAHPLGYQAQQSRIGLTAATM